MDCPQGSCGHAECDHNFLSATCGVDDCPCGEDPTFDSRAREAAVGSDWVMSPTEARLRGFA